MACFANHAILALCRLIDGLKRGRINPNPLRMEQQFCQLKVATPLQSLYSGTYSSQTTEDSDTVVRERPRILQLEVTESMSICPLLMARGYETTRRDEWLRHGNRRPMVGMSQTEEEMRTTDC